MKRILTLLAFVLAVALGSARPAASQENYTVQFSLLGGLGGAFDLSPDAGLDNDVREIAAAFVSDYKTLVGVRAGRMSFDGEQGFGGLAQADLDYLVVAGEYRYPATYYDVGVFLGLGGYRVDGRDAFDEESRDEALGISFGVTGQFRIVRHLSLVGVLEGHYAFFDEANFFGAGLVGLAIHF